MGLIGAWKMSRFNYARQAHFNLKMKIEHEDQRLDGCLLGQRAIGGHKFIVATKLTETELRELIPQQVRWLRSRLIRLASLEQVLVMHPKIARLIEWWVEQVQQMPKLDKPEKK